MPSQRKWRELNTTGKRLRMLRLAHGWTQDQLSEAIKNLTGVDVSRPYISRLELDDDVQPTLEVLVALARTLGTSLDYLGMTTHDPRPTQRGEPPSGMLDLFVTPTDEADELAAELRSLTPEQRADLLALVEIMRSVDPTTAANLVQMKRLKLLIEAKHGETGRDLVQRVVHPGGGKGFAGVQA